MKIEQTAAYQGKGWKPRKQDARGVWASHTINSEWAPLKAVVLYCPRGELRKIKNPLAVQHLAPVALPLLQRQMKKLASVYRSLGVQVLEVLPPRSFGKVPPNLMFARDLFFNSPGGAVISRMASEVRAGEEKFGAVTLSESGVMIRGSITGRGIFEGSADAMWLTPRLVVVGLGNRTNREGFSQLRELLASQGIDCVAVRMPRGIQHLLGLLQVVDRKTAVVRAAKAPTSLLKLLKKMRFRVILVKESDEVRHKLGFNFVVLGPRKILMASSCPELRAQLVKAGLRVAAELDISQMARAAGGLGCVTGILSRRTVK
jgi:N-dimethylarginine dimethylaminohydrolase